MSVWFFLICLVVLTLGNWFCFAANCNLQVTRVTKREPTFVLQSPTWKPLYLKADHKVGGLLQFLLLLLLMPRLKARERKSVFGMSACVFGGLFLLVASLSCPLRRSTSLPCARRST